MSLRSKPYLAVAVGVSVAFALTACSSGGSSSPKASAVTTSAASAPAPSTSATATASAVPAKATPASLVAKVILNKKDIATGYLIKVIPGGNQVKGQVTLDNCGYNFTSEAHRVARLQVQVLSPKHEDTGISNEVVAYDNAADAQLALTQFRSSMKLCHKNVYWKSTVASEPPTRYLSFSDAPVKGLPAKANDVASMVATAKGMPQKLYLTVILQTKGTVLDALYFESPAKPSTAEINAVSTLAVLSGRRLVAL